jgi:hypothetical protein
VLSGTGYTGRCFSGYLRELEKPRSHEPEDAADTPPAEYAGTVASAVETVEQKPGNSLPLVVVLAAAGALLAGGVAVFLLRRKK